MADRDYASAGVRGVSGGLALLSFVVPIVILVQSAPKPDLGGLAFSLVFLLWTAAPTIIPWMLLRRAGSGRASRMLVAGQLLSFLLATAFYAKILHAGYESPLIFFVMPAGVQWVILGATMVAAEMRVAQG